MHTKSLLVFSQLVLQLLSVTAFQPIFRSTSVSRTSLTKRFESKDDEIAELEEKLKQLKAEKKEEKEAAEAISEEALEEVPLDMFLTEQWKESEREATEGSGGGLMNVLYAVGAVLFVVLFSQIPIGQEDLSKYSVGSSPAAEQIDLGDLNRARRAGDL